MVVHVEWYDEGKTIIHYRYGQRWTWEDLIAAMEQTKILAAEVDHAFDQIVDMSAAPLMPQGNMLAHLSSIRGMQPKNVRATAVVGRSVMLNIIRRLMSATASGGRRRNFALYPTLEEALAWLKTAPAEEESEDRWRMTPQSTG